MANPLLYFMSCVNLLSLLIAVGIGLWRWALLSASLRFAWAGLLSYFLLFGVQVVAALTETKLNYTLTNYAITACFGAAFALCFALAVPPGRSRRLILGLGALGFTGLVAEAAGLTEGLPVTRLATPFQTIINTLLPLIYLRYLTRTARSSLLLVPLFWISVGRLVSSLSSTLYDVLETPLAESSRELLIQWQYLRFAITSGCNLVYAFGFWKTKRR